MFYEVALSSKFDNHSRPLLVAIDRTIRYTDQDTFRDTELYWAANHNVSYYLSGGDVMDYESMMPSLNLLFFNTSLLFPPSYHQTWASSLENMTRLQNESQLFVLSVVLDSDSFRLVVKR